MQGDVGQRMKQVTNEGRKLAVNIVLINRLNFYKQMYPLVSTFRVKFQRVGHFG